MPRNNSVYVRGEVVDRPYFDMVPNRRTGERVAFFRVLVDCPRDESQPRDERHVADRIRVVAYGRLAEALRGRVKRGDWLIARGWIQVRKREDAEEQSMALTIAEIIAVEIDHFTPPFVPGSDLMERLERQAEMRSQPVRDLLTRMVTLGLVQLERESQTTVLSGPEPVSGNGAHG